MGTEAVLSLSLVRILALELSSQGQEAAGGCAVLSPKRKAQQDCCPERLALFHREAELTGDIWV